MMEEAANPTPSSTLAPEMPTTTAGEAKANTTSIKLLIKASNQQHDDQIIESDLLWTVFRLKTQLSLVYPSKPPVAEQKLIYSGQLLNDRAQLKDIIRSYKDVYTQHHILHLVYTPKNQQTPPQKSTKMAPTSSADGLRQRHNAQSNSSSSSGSTTNNNPSPSSTGHAQQVPQQQQAPFPYGFWANGLQQPQQQQQQLFTNNAFTSNQIPTTNSNNISTPVGFDMQALAAHQAAMYNWMWQTYGQYMRQYSQSHAAYLPSSHSSTTPNATTNRVNPVIPLPSFAPVAFLLPTSSPPPAPYLSQQQPQIPTASTTTTTTTPSTTAQPAEPAQNQQQQQQQEQNPAEVAAQPRFPNIVQEEQENRDWLDSFFSVMRLALFLTILYFNSSPLRCFLVFLIAGGIYLYHIGFFRPRQERNNNDINRINNAAAEPAVARQAEENPAQDQIENALADLRANIAEEMNARDGRIPREAPANSTASEGNNADATATASNAAQDVAAIDNNSTSVIAFMRSFIVSFFTSLLPETPAAL